MKSLTMRLFTLLLGFFIAYGPAMAQSSRPLPKLTAKNPNLQLKVSSLDAKGLWPAVMGWLGKYDQVEKCWMMNLQNRFFCMKPTKLEKFNYGDNNGFGFVITGNEKRLRGKQFEDIEANQMSGGAVAFLHFYTSDFLPKNVIKFASIDGFYSLGSNGYPPEEGDFKLVEFGHESIAWAVDTYGGGAGGAMGTLTSFIAFFGMYDVTRTSILARFVSRLDNSGGCGKEIRVACEEQTISYRFIPSSRVVHDLELTYSERVGDNKTFEINSQTPTKYTQKIVLPFNQDADARAHVYRLPNRQNQTMIDWFGEQAKKGRR